MWSVSRRTESNRMNNYAIATDELATALQDGAAALQTAGKQHCQNL